MLKVLLHQTYRNLFLAQVIALLGTGLLSVALALLAFDLAGDQAGAVLGTAFAIKMLAYVGFAPMAHAITENLSRKLILIGADLIRASIALCLPFIDSVWQIYILIFVLQAASATFTPAFQAVIPDILKDEKDYTNALSLSRLAYDLENLLSPVLAGILLGFLSYHYLFGGTVIGFAGSAILVAITRIPSIARSENVKNFSQRLTKGLSIYLATPRLRGLLALNMTAAATGAFILVNTVVIVKLEYQFSQTDVATALMAFGGGSMLTALLLPYLLQFLTDRTVMCASALLLSVLTLSHAILLSFTGFTTWFVFIVIWMVSGLLYSAILTPSGRLLSRSAHPRDRPALFTAHFALSHACWLITYPIAGWIGKIFGLPEAMALLGSIAFIGFVAAVFFWPHQQNRELEHEHTDLAPDHPHLREYHTRDRRHRHLIVIDDEHKQWPTNG